MLELKAFEGQDHQAHILAHLIFGGTPMVAALPAVAIQLQKHVMEHVKLASRERAAVAYMQKVTQRQGEPMSPEEMLEVEALTAQFVAEGMQQVKELSQQLSGAGQEGPDPLIALKQQELELRAQRDQADAQIDQSKVQLDAETIAMRDRQFGERIAAQERQTAARIDAAREREILKQQGR